MAEILDARVKQKTGVAADFTGFTLLEGEFALVRSSSDGPVINYKVGPGLFDSLPWSLQVPGTVASVSPSTDFDALPAGLYLPDSDGTYDGTVAVDLTEGVTYLNWDGSTLTKQLYPINLSGYVRTSVDGFTGDMSTVSTGNAAVDRTYILPISQTGRPSTLTIKAFRAGPMLLKLLNRNGSDFSFIREFTVTVTSGINTIDLSQYLLDLSPSTVLGFRYDGPTTSTGLVAYTAGGSTPMFYISGDFTSTTPTTATALNTFDWGIRVDYPVDPETVANTVSGSVSARKIDRLTSARTGITGFYGNIESINTAPSNPIQIRTFAVLDDTVTGALSHIIVNATRAGTIKFKVFNKVSNQVFEFASETTKTLALGYNSVIMDITLAPNQVIGWLQDEPDANAALIGYRNQGSPVGTHVGSVTGDITSGSVQFQPFNENFDFAIQFFVRNPAQPDIMGQNLAFLGDSITSSSQGYTYAFRVRDWSLARTYTNVAIGGATWAWRAGTVETDDPQPGDDTNVLGNQVLKLLAGIGTVYATPDVVVLSAAINDVAREHPIGDIDTIFNTPYASLDQHDFIAAIRWCVETIYNNIPNVRIFLLTPLHSTVTERNFTATNPYSEAIRASAERLNVPVIDCFSEALIYESRASTLLADGLHPTPTGQLLMAKYVWSQLKSRYYNLTV